jgi:hypothetical protein
VVAAAADERRDVEAAAGAQRRHLDARAESGADDGDRDATHGGACQHRIGGLPMRGVWPSLPICGFTTR